jgi:soluble cytochrome b562
LIEDFRTYVNDLENFVTTLSSELMLPDNLRKDALDFILLHRATFQKLLSNNPDIDDTDYKEGIDKYLDYIDNIENRKYNKKRSQFRREYSIDMDIEMVGVGHRGEGQTRPVIHLG